jgi:flagellar FliL protein
VSVTADSLKSSPAKAGGKAGEAEGPPKKSKKKLIIIVLVLVLLIGGYEAKSILLKTTYKPGQAVPDGKILPIDQLTVNLEDGHLVQASISMQLTVVATPAALSALLPRFDDAAITLFGEETQKQLLDPVTKAAFKAEMLAQFQKIAGTADGAAQKVSAIYFTGFVIQ